MTHRLITTLALALALLVSTADAALRDAEDGYRVHDPGQQWQTHFDGSGFTTRPDAGAWTWGLQLVRYGFAGQERDVVRPMRTAAEGSRIAYDWDATLQEWYVNDARGLEHGYTVHHRPEGDGDDRGPLSFTLAVRGGLIPSVASDGRSVRFTDGIVTVVTYSGLTVFDATGTILPARLELAPEGLRLTVEERGALYPLTIDPIAQQGYLKPTHPGAGDFFGSAVAVSGDTVVIGAASEDSNATGINGDLSDNSAANSGAAYVYVRDGLGWVLQAELKASNADVGDFFGTSVSISDDTVVIGARGEKSNATGVDGDQTNNSSFSAGAAYVFVRTGTTWSQQAYLKGSNTEVSDSFGSSVSVSGDTVLVGATREDSNATGIDGDQADNSLLGSGAVYVFVRSGTAWSQQAYLKASNAGAADSFGDSLMISGDTVVVGATMEASNALGVDGDETDDSAAQAGASYVFVRSGTTWSQQAYLKASNTAFDQRFGASVSVSGETLVVGAPFESTPITWVGAAYVFVRSGTTWSQQAYLKASNIGGFDAFGTSVSLSGETLLIGALGEGSDATGVNGNQNNSNAVASGAAYVFTRSGTTWNQQTYLKASNTGKSDQFGCEVALSAGMVVIGAPHEDSNGSGVNGDQFDNSFASAGAAYLFDLASPPFTDLGGASPGVAGLPNLTGTGTLVGGSQYSLTLTNTPPDARLVGWFSFAPTAFPALGGTVHAFPYQNELQFVADATGSFMATSMWPVGLPACTNVWFQFIVEDLTSVDGITLSNGLIATTP